MTTAFLILAIWAAIIVTAGVGHLKKIADELQFFRVRTQTLDELAETRQNVTRIK